MHWRLNGKDTAAAHRNNAQGQALPKKARKTVLILYGVWVFKCVVCRLV